MLDRHPLQDSAASGLPGSVRADLARRAMELRAEHPDWVFRPTGTPSELDDIGHRGFQWGPPDDQPPMVSGMDIARTHGGITLQARRSKQCPGSSRRLAGHP